MHSVVAPTMCVAMPQGRPLRQSQLSQALQAMHCQMIFGLLTWLLCKGLLKRQMSSCHKHAPAELGLIVVKRFTQHQFP